MHEKGSLRSRSRNRESRQVLGLSRQASYMNPDFIDALIIGFVAAVLFLLVDKYEREGPMARLLKFLLLFVAGVAILHKLQPLLGLHPVLLTPA
jgi:hypothetical protein